MAGTARRQRSDAAQNREAILAVALAALTEPGDAAAHLREGLQAAIRAGDWFDVADNGLWYCAMLCAATGRPAEAVTLWAALDIQIRPQGGSGAGFHGDVRRREEAQGKARQALDPAGPGQPNSAARR